MAVIAFAVTAAVSIIGMLIYSAIVKKKNSNRPEPEPEAEA